MSTWQLGVKHSITKRRTHGRCWEVRLGSVAGPHRVLAPFSGLSALVGPGLGTRSAKECVLAGSWLKRYGSVCANQSVARRRPTSMPTAPVRPRARPPVPSPVGTPLLREHPRRPPLGLPEQHPADTRHGGETDGRSGGSGQRRPVPDEDDGHQDAAERRPADDIAHRVLRRSGRRLLGAWRGDPAPPALVRPLGCAAAALCGGRGRGGRS